MGGFVLMDTQTAINLTAGAMLSVLGWLAKTLWDAVGDLKQDLHNIEVDLPKTYLSKEDFHDTMSRIEDMFKYIQTKLDGKVDK